MRTSATEDVFGLSTVFRVTCAAILALALSACASMTPPAPFASSPDRGAEKYPAGPLYNGDDYLGDDPDPFVRSQIRRDLGMRYPGMG